MIIYKITNLLNGKIYIGQTVQKLTDRWSDHSRPCRGTSKIKSAIASAIRKYGKENFKIEQIDSTDTLEKLNTIETTYIKAFNCLSPNGYNLELGGQNKACHEETKAKISNTLKGRPIKNRQNGAAKGRPVTLERRERISKTLTGQTQPWKYKEVMVVETGQIFESITSAAKALGLNRATIWSLLKSGKRSRGGFTVRNLKNDILEI